MQCSAALLDHRFIYSNWHYVIAFLHSSFVHHWNDAKWIVISILTSGLNAVRIIINLAVNNHHNLFVYIWNFKDSSKHLHWKLKLLLLVSDSSIRDSFYCCYYFEQWINSQFDYKVHFLCCCCWMWRMMNRWFIYYYLCRRSMGTFFMGSLCLRRYFMYFRLKRKRNRRCTLHNLKRRLTIKWLKVNVLL